MTDINLNALPGSMAPCRNIVSSRCHRGTDHFAVESKPRRDREGGGKGQVVFRLSPCPQ